MYYKIAHTKMLVPTRDDAYVARCVSHSSPRSEYVFRRFFRMVCLLFRFFFREIHLPMFRLNVYRYTHFQMKKKKIRSDRLCNVVVDVLVVVVVLCQ